MKQPHIIVLGSKELKKKLKSMGRSASHELGKALYIEGEGIMGQSKSMFVPVDTGLLRSTGHVEIPRPGPLVLLGYGGPAAKYALAQHENLGRHKVGQRKYLEIPMLAAIPGMDHRIGRNLQKWLFGRASKSSARRR